MKIGILTQALHSNYGGILQNYALQEILRKIGHEPITIDRHIPIATSFIKESIKLTLQKIKPKFDVSLLTRKQRASLSRLQQIFIQENINRTNIIYTQNEFDAYINNNPMDAYIVGSDQCWRPCYSANIKNYFLDFADDKTKKIAYAASFGVDTWEYNNETTAIVKKYAKLLNSISVREHSGINLCREKLDVDSTWVLDPTMLLGKEGFMRFITPETNKSYILNYLLEESTEARALVEYVAHKTNTLEIRANFPSPIFSRKESLQSHLYISVEQWLSNIYNASFVVTDSFHGAVFSILFNVPFIVKLNAVRGNARLESLLTDFDLMSCICNDLNQVAIPTFNWNKINTHLAERQKASMSFLLNALNK